MRLENNLPDRVVLLESDLAVTKAELRALRKDYDAHLVQALWISGGTIALFIALTFFA